MKCRRVLRGGSYFSDSWYLRSTVRYWYVPEDRDRVSGFRLVIVRKKKP